MWRTAWARAVTSKLTVSSQLWYCNTVLMIHDQISVQTVPLARRAGLSLGKNVFPENTSRVQAIEQSYVIYLPSTRIRHSAPARVKDNSDTLREPALRVYFRRHKLIPKVHELRSRGRHGIENSRQYCTTVQSSLEALLRTIISVTALPKLSPTEIYESA